ncbi:microtubule-associated protein futsch isoform X1 [Drosophila sulfurigaster albostrigata]|uniref:microtubule-associated protein futsch isoform X1 n=1 Tax=Drosophila sulfurigaster albostrigata TaxID=89887 RepID=UPI002D21EB92|nr:microtubule-associated protein futsch isoform X1 [Drosophila sulfurigaster albostrigata]
MCDELDIYDDLDDFQKVEDEKSKELQAWETKYANAQVEISNYQMQNKALEKKIRTMEVNFQNLLDTAKAEIKRKDTMITQLRKEKDDICFRRKWPNKSEPAESNQKTEHKRILKQEESAKAMSDVAVKSEKREKVTKDEKVTPAKLQDKLKSQKADCDKKDNRHSKQPSSNKSSHHRSVDTCRNRDRSRRRTRSRSRSRSRHRDWNRREAREEKSSTGSSRTRSTKDSCKRRRSNSRSRSRSGSSQHSHNNKNRKNSCSDSVSSRERESNLENRNKAKLSEMHSGKTTKQVNPTEGTLKEHTAKVNKKNKEERCAPTDQLTLQNPSAEDSKQIVQRRKTIDHSSNIIDSFPEINLKAENNQVNQDAERDSFEGKPIDKSEDASSRGAPGENESKDPSASLTHASLMIPGLDLVNCEEHNMESIRCPKDALKIKICESTVKNSDRTAEEVLSKDARNDQEATELTNAGIEIPNKSAPTKIESEVPKSEIEECKDAKITDETPSELIKEDKFRDNVDQSLLPEESDRKDEQVEVFDKDIGSEDLPILNDDKPQPVECPLALDTMVNDSIRTSERKNSSKDLEDMNLCTPLRNVSPIIEHSREDDIATPERHVSAMPANSDNEALLSDVELHHSTQPREVANVISIVEPPTENNILTQQGETRSATGIQIIEDIRLPVMMDIEHIALRVDGLNEDSQDKNESEYATENANVEHNKQQFVEKARKVEDSNVKIIVDKKIELELVVTTSLLPKPAIVASTVMYAQPDSTKVDHNEDDQNEEAAIKSASLPEDTSEKSFDIDYPNTSLEAENIEVALKHLHHQSHTSVEEQPDEATVTSTSMKTPKQDLLKILTQSPVQQPAAASGNAVSHYPKKLKNKMKKTGVRTASERTTPIKSKASSITPEKGDTTPLKKRKINLDHKDDEIVPQTPSETAIAASPPAVNVTIEETLNASGLEQDKSCGSDSSIVTKRCSLGHSDYQFERINDEVVLRVTRRGRRRRVAPSVGNERY